MVQIKSREEIVRTLDINNWNRGTSFDPELSGTAVKPGYRNVFSRRRQCPIRVSGSNDDLAVVAHQSRLHEVHLEGENVPEPRPRNSKPMP